MRVGIIGLMHESNTFLPTPTTLESFRDFHLLRGDAVRQAYESAYHEIGGFYAALAEAQIEAVSLFGGWAMPGGTITHETCEQLVAGVLAALVEAGPLDGVLVAPHGAAVGEQWRDFDGHWLSAVRQHVGSDVPIIGTLDLHANVSQRMVDACQALIAYRTNPHLDQRQRGLDAGRLMARTLRGEVRPVMSAGFPRVAINIERQLTAASPCRELYALAERQLHRPGILSNSVVLGFPYSDVPEMGTSVLVVADDNRALADWCAAELNDYVWEHRREFVGQLVNVDDAIRQATDLTGPVGLLDMGDNVGGGSPGDGTLLLAKAIAGGIASTFACLYDQSAVQACVAAGIGATLPLAFGGKTDALHGPTLHDTVRVVSLHDGRFSELQPRHGGQTHYDQGPSAVVQLSGGQTVLFNSRRTAPFSLAQITSCGIRGETFQLVIIKGVHAPVAAYQPICKHLLRVDTPGVTRADMTQLEFHHLRRPLFPFENECSST